MPWRRTSCSRTRRGLVKKTRLGEFDSPRSGGVIAINLREDDEVISARLIGESDDLLLVSAGAQSLRFTATDEALRPMGRATSGVIGMRFSNGDELLAMMVAGPGSDVLVATDGGYAKRTSIDEYRIQGRGGLGIRTARITEARGRLVGALNVQDSDEVLAITSGGGVIRTRAAEVRRTGRDTMGVRLVSLAEGDSVVAIARNAEASAQDVIDEAAVGADSTDLDGGVTTDAPNGGSDEDVADYTTEFAIEDDPTAPPGNGQASS